MTPERKAEIKAATKENPVILTRDEVTELREENKHRFQHDVGAGHFIIPTVDGSPANRMLSMAADGKSNAEIGEALGLSENTVRRVLSRVY